MGVNVDELGYVNQHGLSRKVSLMIRPVIQIAHHCVANSIYLIPSRQVWSGSSLTTSIC